VCFAHDNRIDKTKLDTRALKWVLLRYFRAQKGTDVIILI